ncbi:MAG: DUF1549 and DUF1553 domain-containing protein [Planctomycetota bacterium]|nr:DUF1549 and DUF1553 domain-containing protein [Planctomycetota bacterium]
MRHTLWVAVFLWTVMFSAVGEVRAETGPVDFERDILPIFTRFGCNAGSCHGKQAGQNGFKLSLLAFDADFDFDALTKEGRGRRIFSVDPERSLLLSKPTGRNPHGGGKRLEPDGPEYRRLLTWIRAGMPRRVPGAARLERITVKPEQEVLTPRGTRQIQVTAHYSDGTKTDVTRYSQFQSNEAAIAGVDDSGRVTAQGICGEAAIMARYMGQIAVFRPTIPLSGNVPERVYNELPRKNFIDSLVWKKLQRLRITPSKECSDEKYLRRVYIDIIGRVPTTEEATAFLDESKADRRRRLVDSLLEQPEYAEHWANKWADLLRPNPYRVGIKAVLNYDAWVRRAFRQNMPYDQFVRELVTARGSTYRNGAVTLFRDRRDPGERTTIITQLFLGIRLECARCHHHPFEVWAQEDFYSFAAYFTNVSRKGTGLSPPISGSEEVFFTTAGSSTMAHPRTGATLVAKPLFGTAPALDGETDPRESLATWMTSKQNPFFAKVMVNRVWADLMGRGLVEPVDDLRATNPPTNPELLDALAKDFQDADFDIKALVRRIAGSHVYALSSLPGKRNVQDTRNYSRHYRQRLRAEVMLDAIVGITGIPESFSGMPPGSRAKELWTTRIGSLFLDAFGRPDPNQDPPCERTPDTTVVQSLHLMNSKNLYAKVTDEKGWAAQLSGSKRTPEEIVQQLYLAIYSRMPDSEERIIGRSLFQKKGITRRQATEDLMWALINTPEFVFKD